MQSYTHWKMALAMGWEILWPLILGFVLSAVVQAVVSHQQMSQLLPDDRPRSIATALALGAASSSCSYAAVALARSIFRKGADFTASVAGDRRTRAELAVGSRDRGEVRSARCGIETSIRSWCCRQVRE
jgi:hypothetical protein